MTDFLEVKPRFHDPEATVAVPAIEAPTPGLFTSMYENRVIILIIVASIIIIAIIAYIAYPKQVAGGDAGRDGANQQSIYNKTARNDPKSGPAAPKPEDKNHAMNSVSKEKLQNLLDKSKSLDIDQKEERPDAEKELSELMIDEQDPQENDESTVSEGDCDDPDDKGCKVILSNGNRCKIPAKGNGVCHRHSNKQAQ
jgi:hypothetical protein